MNTYVTNLGIVALTALLCWAIGWVNFLLIQAPIFMISGSLGIWMFYIQHTFEDSYFEEDEHWEYVKAAVEGSSFYKLPKVMQWLTGAYSLGLSGLNDEHDGNRYCLLAIA